jgi:preprotein translocase subunit SecE
VKSKADVMILKAEDQDGSRLDWLKWSLSIVILLAGMISNHYYSNVSMPVRALVWLMVMAVAAFIATKTQKGKWVVEFFRDSRMEMRKVVWPTREETMQTTMVVGAMVVILSLVLWGMDGILVSLIGWLTGQRG